MKKLILLLTILSIALAGHVYVERPQVKWQNTGYFNALILRFSIENKITKSDFIKVTLPKDFGSCTGTTLAQGTTAITATCSQSTNIYSVQPSTDLSAGTWYTLTLALGGGISEAAGIQAVPIKIQTVSTSTVGGTDNQIVYDENLSCGQFAIDLAPGTDLAVQLSHLKTQVQAPKDYSTGTPAVATYKKLATSYAVYIDVKTKFDYLDGAYIKISMSDNNFIFTGSCSSDANTCVGVGQTGYQSSCVNTTLDSGLCTLSTATGSVGYSLSLEHKGQILKNTWYRIKASVQNPTIYQSTSGSVNAYLYSRQADTYKYYEVKTGGIGDQFGVDKISITDKGILFFWGLREYSVTTAAAATGWGCPVGLYKSAKAQTTITFTAINTASVLKIWNKVTINFKVETSFPTLPVTTTNQKYYKVQVVATKSDIIPLGSLNTNLGMVSGLDCAITDSSGDKTIECQKVSPASAQLYWFTFSQFMYADTAAPTGFGVVKFLQDSTEFTTGSAGYSPATIINDEFLKGYATLFTAANIGKGNQVVDWTETTDPNYAAEAKKIYDPVTQGLARSAMKMLSSTGASLLFLIAPTPDQMCCLKGGTDGTTESANCWKVDGTGRELSGGKCVAENLKLGDSILLRLYANPNVINFDSSSTYKNQGMKRIKENGLFLSAAGKPITASAGIGLYLDTTNAKAIADQTTAKWYNIWQVEAGTTVTEITSQSFAHLAYTCVEFAVALTASIDDYNCVATTNAADPVYPGFTLPSTKLNSNFKGNPLYPNMYELDFILCFRYVAQGGTAAITSNPFIIKGATGTMAEGKLASTGVLQSQVFNGALNAATRFRINIVNFGKTSGAQNIGAVLPALLRVGGNIHADDWASNAGIAMFLDVGFSSTSTDYHADSANACFSAIDSAVTCKTLITTNPAQTLYFYSPAMSRIVINAAVGSATEFNNYVVVKATSTVVGMNMALVSKDSTTNNYDIVKSYPIFGYAFEKTVATNYLYFTATTVGTFTDQTDVNLALISQLTTNTAAAANSCAMAGALAPATGTLYMYAGFSSTTLQISTAFASCSPAASIQSNFYAAQNTDDATRVTKGLWGAHFQVSSQGVKYWSKGDATWGQTKTTDPTNKCVQLMWKKPVTTDTRTKYGIVCPQDNADATQTADKLLKFAAWDFPFFIGAIANPGLSELGFIWTGPIGTVQIYKVQPGATFAAGTDDNTGTKCTLNDVSMPGYKGVAQKLQIKVTTSLSIVLAKDPNVRKLDQFDIGITTVGSIGTTTLIGAVCYTNIDATCTTSALTSFNLQKTFLSTDAATATVTITGEIQLNFWVKATDSAQITTGTYNAQVKAYQQHVGALTAGNIEQNINLCNPSTTNTWTSANAVYNVAVENVALIFDKMSSTQGMFSVSWGINKPFIDFSKFEISLDFISTANTNVVGKNTKCNMMSGNSFDYNFNTLADGAFAAVVAKPKIMTSTVGRELAGTTFKLMCKGALGPTAAITVSNKVTVKYQVNSDDIAFAYDVGFKSGTTEAADRTIETLTTPATESSTSTVKYSIASTDLTKTWNDQGMEAIYSFNLKVTKCDPSVAAGVWIVVEFTRAIPPKLNAKGKLYCEAGFNTTMSQTHCEFDGDRRVKILSNIEMKNTTIAVTGYLFKIYGVEQPDAWLASYKSIYFAVQSSGSIVYQILIDDKDIGTAAPSVLDVLAYSVNTNWTRSTGTFNIDVKLAQGQVANNIDFYVLFPGEFEDGFYKGFSPSCSLVRRLPDWSGFDSTSFIENCTYVNARRIKLFFKVDAANANAAWYYRLSISGVPTPAMPSGGYSYPSVMIPSAAAGTTVAKRTVSGSMNTTFFSFGDDASKTQVKWENMLVYAKIGVYSGIAALLPGKGDKFLEAITLTTTATASFVFLPTTFVISSGLPKLDFKFAPKSTTKPGLSFMEFTTVTTGYAPILPLRVAVLPDKCQVLNDATYKFPYGKGAQSLPFVIDFTDCQPESSIKLKIYALNTSATGLTSINKNFDTTNFTIDGSGTSKEYEVKAGGVPQVSFVVASTDQTVSDKANVGKLVFEFSASTNQASYSIKNVLGQVDSVKPDLIGAVVAWSATSASKTEQTNAKITYATVSYTCDKPSVFYYAASTDNTTLSALTFATIKAKSFDTGSTQTWPEGDKYNIYGYEIDRVGGSAKTFQIRRLKAGAQYFGFGVCVTAAGQSSVNTTSSKFVTWNQTDNDGKPVVTGLTYDQPLNDAQISSSCSAFSNALGLPCNRTVCPNSLLACPPAASATTPSTTTPVANTTANTTVRRRQLQTIFNCSTIANCSTCASNTTCAACVSGQYVNTDLKSCVVTCPANSEIVSGVCTTISTQTELFYTANPDMFAGTDTTASTVSTGLASPDFNTLFLKNANLGTVKFQKYTVYSYSGTPAVGTPSVVASYSGMTDTTVFFKATLNGTDGFVFYGVAEGTPAKPTLDQLKTKTLVNGTLAQGFAVYLKNGGSFNQTIRSLKTGTTYTGYYAAQNIYPDLKTGGATDISSQEFKTTGTSIVPTTFASSISTGFFALLALLFALFILI